MDPDRSTRARPRGRRSRELGGVRLASFVIPLTRARPLTIISHAHPGFQGPGPSAGPGNLLRQGANARIDEEVQP